MSLNSKQMLPDRVRHMRQMGEILDAEDEMLAVLEINIEAMNKKMELLHEELVNEIWLQRHLEELTGGSVEVRKTPSMLQAEIYISADKMQDSAERVVSNFLDKWLPAHLAYKISYDKLLQAGCFLAILWQEDETVDIGQKGEDGNL